MNRFALLAVLLFASSTTAQQVVTQEEDKTLVYQLTVTPASPPEPMLRHRLLVPDAQLGAGNAATFWYRAMLSLEWELDRAEEKLGEALAKADAPKDKTPARLGADVLRSWFSKTPPSLNELPIDLARTAADDLLGWRKTQATVAARRSACDWDLGHRELSGSAAIEFLLPEFQGARDLSRALCLDARVAIADGRLGDALQTLQINNALAQDAAVPPFLVCRLIGGAIARYGFVAVRDLQAAPNAPSLYWALAEMPRPFIDWREAIRYEAGIGPRLYPLIDDPANANRTEAEWNRLLAECLDSLVEQAAFATKSNPPTKESEQAEQLIERINSLRTADRNQPGVQFATTRLLASGYDEASLIAMPIARLLAIDALAAYERATQAVEATYQLPWAENADARRTAYAALNDEANPLGDSPHREVVPIATLTAAATQAATSSLVRLDRDIAALRLVAALRLHAAAAGELPRTLDEITVVPVPRNPATGAAFDYRLNEETAVITLPKSDGLVVTERYEIRLAK